MDDLWYYAEGDKPVGPLSLPEMTAILARVSDARNVLVWREGFSNWIKAENVSDLAPYAIRPPASPISPPLGLQESKAAPTSPTVIGEVRAKYAPPEENHLVGIGGWLILVAIGQVLGPLRFVHFLFGYYVNFNTNLWSKFPITFYGEIILNMSVITIMGFTTYLFFTRSRLFLDFFIYECAAYIMLLPLGIVFKEVTFNAYTGRWIPIKLEPKPVGEWITTIVLAAIWISYIKLSKRVANTFRR